MRDMEKKRHEGGFVPTDGEFGIEVVAWSIASFRRTILTFVAVLFYLEAL